MAFQRLHTWIDRLATLPGILHLRRALFTRRFRRPMGHAFHGVYESHEAACQAIPPSLPTGYDHPQAAGLYVDRLEVRDHDYPALFWLQDAFAAGLRSVADLGGSIGIKFYAFQGVPALPPDVRWRVIEVPAAVTLGREIALQRGAGPGLEFSSQIADADGTDVLFASGSLQYLPQSLGEVLAGLPRKPRRVLVNTTPIHPSRSFFTLNNIGAACCVYRVSAHDEFIAQVVAQGYRLRAEWRNLAKALPLPYEPGYSLDHYSGFCFDRAGGE